MIKDKLWEHLYNEHNLLLLESELADIRVICKNEINWDNIQSSFYNELSKNKEFKHPRTVLEWIKKEVNEYLK